LGAGGPNWRLTKSAGRAAAGVGEGRAFDPAAYRTREPEFGHQPLDGAASHLDPLAIECQPHFARPVHPVVRGMNPFDLWFESLITDLTPAKLPVDMLVIRRWGNLHAELYQPGADRLDTPPQTIRALAAAPMVGDESTD
jgi:hypothetical protein